MSTDNRLVDYDPLTLIREDYVYDHADDRAHLVLSQDCSPILEEAQRLRNASPGWGGSFVPIAKLSLVQCVELMRIGIMDRGWVIRDEAAFQVWLDDRNKLKLTDGKF